MNLLCRLRGHAFRTIYGHAGPIKFPCTRCGAPPPP